MLVELKRIRTEEKKANRNQLRAAASALLEKRRAIPVEEFERILLAEFAGKLPKGDLTGKSRSRAENEIDWVKAELTRRLQIEYFTINACRLIVWLPLRGSYDGDALTNRYDVLLALRAIGEEAKVAEAFVRL